MVARPLLAMSLALGIAGCGGTRASDPTTVSSTAADSPTPAATTPTREATPPPPVRPRGQVQQGAIVYVSDGDTVGVTLDGVVRRVRLLGIDAPETKDPDAPVGCYGRRASARANALMPRHTRVTVVTDPTQDRIDKFGRLLAYVFPAGTPRSINEQLLRDGAARVYVYRRNRPPVRIVAFRRAEAFAKAARRGLWGACPTR